MVEPTTDKMNLPELDFAEIKQFIAEMHVFFKIQYNYIPFGMIQTTQPVEKNGKTIEYFFFEKSEEPLYKRVQAAADVGKMLALLLSEARKMAAAIDDICEDYEIQIEDVDIIKSFEMISNQANRFSKTIDARSKKIGKELDEAMDVDEMQDVLYRFIARLLKENLIQRIIPAIFRGMQVSHAQVYSLFLGLINNFLQKLGVQTKRLKVGDKIDFETCRPVESKENRTNDYKLNERIKEIHQPPYLFDIEHLIVEGEAVIWSFDDGA